MLNFFPDAKVNFLSRQLFQVLSDQSNETYPCVGVETTEREAATTKATETTIITIGTHTFDGQWHSPHELLEPPEYTVRQVYLESKSKSKRKPNKYTE